MDEPAPVKPQKSIYDVSYPSIFLRNFLAGFGRAFGSIMVYLLFGGIIYYFALTYVLPQVQHLTNSVSSLLSSPLLQKPSATNEPKIGPSTNPKEIQETFELFRQQSGPDQPPQE